MNIPSILGIIGTLVGLIRAVPQLVRLLQTRETFGVSADSAGISSVVSFGWMVYGILTNQPYGAFATGLSGVIFALSPFYLYVLGVRYANSRLPQSGLSFCC